ncbi:MAG: hypothetical protein ACR2OE_02460 [Thermomicrobiales bacterium]
MPGNRSPTSLAHIVMPLLIYSMMGSAWMVGFIALVLILPRVILAPLTGLLADRADAIASGHSALSFYCFNAVQNRQMLIAMTTMHAITLVL